MSSVRRLHALLLVLLSHAACHEVVVVLNDGQGGAAGGAASGSGGPANGEAGGRAGATFGGAPDAGEPGEPAQAGTGSIDPALGAFVDAGDAHACVTRAGALYCWGAGADGRLGLADTDDRDEPARVGRDADWISVATGVAHTCALKSDGSVWCFGASNVGQLGQGATESSSVPVRVPLPGPVRHLSSEANTACVVLQDHTLYCWGRNWEGNIGLNDTHPGVDQLSPIRSGERSDWVLTGTGDGHTCGVRGAGLLFGWGRNTAANLGLGQTNDQQRRVATQIGEDADWQAVVSGQDSSCGIRSGDQLFCWGGNSFGNLGLGDAQPRLVPTRVAPEVRWVQVAIDTFHGCGIDAESSLYCWGRGIEGQLGTSDNDERLEPVLVGQGMAQVAVGRMFTCAVSRAGAVSCTGENAAGQLGVGGRARRNVFSELSF